MAIFVIAEVKFFNSINRKMPNLWGITNWPFHFKIDSKEQNDNYIIYSRNTFAVCSDLTDNVHLESEGVSIVMANCISNSTFDMTWGLKKAMRQ